MSYENVNEAGRYLLDLIGSPPTVALVLGSGLTGLESLLAASTVVDYRDIPHFPETTVETPAEIATFRTLGADAVGMSTVPEAIVARHMGMRVAGIFVLSNIAAHQRAEPITHQEVLDAGQRAPESLSRLFDRFLDPGN